MGEEDSAREADLPELPYTRHCIETSDVAALVGVLGSDRITQGPEVRRFERAIAEYTGAQLALAVSSGTAALELALAALEVGPGDEVIVPPLTFVATCNAVVAQGATPVFADVEPDTLNLSAEAVAAATGPRTRGAIAVHYAGHPADTPGIQEALGPRRFLLEDAAHALGATLDGRPAGSLGDAACFSFHPAKLITTGEGGAITTDSVELMARLCSLREHGIERDSTLFEGLDLPVEFAAEEKGNWVYELHYRSSNHRLSDLAAALGRSQLARADTLLERRRAIATRYTEAFADLDVLELPLERSGARSAWHLYPVRVRLDGRSPRRADVYRTLRDRGIGVQIHYVPVHLQPYYRRSFGTGFGTFPVSEDAYLRLLSLPLFPAMSEPDVDRVIEAVWDALGESSR